MEIPPQHLYDLAAEFYGVMVREETAVVSGGGDAPEEDDSVWRFAFKAQNGIGAYDLAVAFAAALTSFRKPSSTEGPIIDKGAP